MKRADRLLRVLAAALSLAFAPHALPADIAALAERTGPDREARLLDGARKEGEVNVYTSLVVEDIGALAAAFEKKYGVRVKYWRASSEKLVQRALTEARSGRHDVDVIETTGPELEALARERLLSPARSGHDADLLPESLRAHRQWTGVRLNMFVQGYNTSLIRKEDLPKTYRDLLDPKWKGKLAIEAEDFDWFAAAVKGMGEAEGLKFFRELAARNGIMLRKGHTLLASLVASGEAPFALTLYNHNVDRLKQRGAPIEWFAIQPAYARVNGISVTRGSPHPHAALLFFDYMLGPEGQAILQKANYIPTNLKLNNPNTRSGVRFIDPAMVLDEQARWEKQFNDIIARQAR
jgi:iron(III) transport system substrate-binding protein